MTRFAGLFTSLLLLLFPPLELLLVVAWLLVSPSLLVLEAETLEFEEREMVGVLVLVKVTGTLTVGEPNSDTERDQLVSSQPRPAPRPGSGRIVLYKYE